MLLHFNFPAWTKTRNAKMIWERLFLTVFLAGIGREGASNLVRRLFSKDLQPSLQNQGVWIVQMSLAGCPGVLIWITPCRKHFVLSKSTRKYFVYFFRHLDGYIKCARPERPLKANGTLPNWRAWVRSLQLGFRFQPEVIKMVIAVIIL